ncbi:hypothetical protein ACFFX0_14295 [Citricoccus parietis]|uniref:DUF4236 domain-containing protein n=1 Tax=Citricoccus parietis TaxID=592307 RepID=A0ABV5G033_9MICC
MLHRVLGHGRSSFRAGGPLSVRPGGPTAGHVSFDHGTGRLSRARRRSDPEVLPAITSPGSHPSSARPTSVPAGPVPRPR